MIEQPAPAGDPAADGSAGVALVAPDGTLVFADAAAQQVLRIDELPAAAPPWLSAACERTAAGEVTEETDGDARASIQRVGAAAFGGCVVRVTDVAAAESRERLLHVVRGQAVARLYGGIAHDMRSPLNGVMMNVEMLRRLVVADVGDGRAAGRREQRYVLALDEELGRLRRHIDTVLDTLAPFGDVAGSPDLRDCVASLAPLLASQARGRRIRLAIDLAPEPLPTTVPRAELWAVVAWIAASALAHTGDGGRLAVTADVARGRISLAAVPEPSTGDHWRMAAAASRIVADFGGRLVARRQGGLRLELPPRTIASGG